MNYIATWIKWFASFFINVSGGGTTVSIGAAILTAGIGLITFTVTTTTTTTIFFGLITRGESVQATPYVAIGWLLVGFAAVIFGWSVFVS